MKLSYRVTMHGGVTPNNLLKNIIKLNLIADIIHLCGDTLYRLRVENEEIIP